MDFANRLKLLREAAGISTTDLGQKVGLSQSAISKLENGKRRIDLEILQDICKALNISLMDFLVSESVSLPSDINQLIETTKKLPPDERKALNEFLKLRVAAAEPNKNNVLEMPINQQDQLHQAADGGKANPITEKQRKEFEEAERQQLDNDAFERDNPDRR